jgi:hypothetical protein
MEERFRMIEDLEKGCGISEVSRLYGVSRPKVYLWRDRHRAEGLEGLRQQSRAPHQHPNQIRGDQQGPFGIHPVVSCRGCRRGPHPCGRGSVRPVCTFGLISRRGF